MGQIHENTKKELLNTGYFYAHDSSKELRIDMQMEELRSIEFKGEKLYVDNQFFKDAWEYIHEWHFDNYLNDIVIEKYHYLLESVISLYITEWQILEGLEKEKDIIMDEFDLQKPKNRIFWITHKMNTSFLKSSILKEKEIILFATEKKFSTTFLHEFRLEWPQDYIDQFDALINTRVVKKINEYIIHLQIGGEIRNFDRIIKPTIYDFLKSRVHHFFNFFSRKEVKTNKSFTEPYSSISIDKKAEKESNLLEKGNMLDSNKFYLDKDGNKFHHSVIALFYRLKGIHVRSKEHAKELVKPYGLTSGSTFYNHHYTKNKKMSNRLAANGEDKKAYKAVVEKYQKTVELCEFHDDRETKIKIIEELQKAEKQLDIMYPEK